jgi:hypothetical protein
MATFYQIPTFNDVAWYQFKIILSGATFFLRMRYNTRMQRWILDITDPSNNDILDGMPLLIDRDFLNQYVIPNLPAGKIIVSSSTGSTSNQPSRYSFGSEDVLLYYDPDS